MTVAQNKAARRAGNLRRRKFGPGPADQSKSAKREKEKLERLKAMKARKGKSKK